MKYPASFKDLRRKMQIKVSPVHGPRTGRLASILQGCTAGQANSDQTGSV